MALKVVYVDTSFFISLMNSHDPLHADAQKIHNKYKKSLETSLLTIAELLVGCEKRGLDPEILVSSIFQIAAISGITLEQALRAAHYLKEKNLSAIDALHAGLSNFEIISSDKDLDRVDVNRIWV
jgi:predicted nucleic acid-binding protein